MKTTQWKHQKEAFDFAMPRMEKGVALFMDMGTGKSKVVVDLICNIEEKPLRIVILCPKTVAPVWPREFRKHSWKDFHITNFSGMTAGRREKEITKMQNAYKAGNNTVAILNYELAYRDPFATFLMKGNDLLVCDESHKIKSPSGQASRFCGRLAKKSKRRILLTGTPLPHSPEDIYAQFRAMNTEIFGHTATAFRNRFSVQWGQYPSQRKWFTDGEYENRIAENSYRIKASEALELPEAIHEAIPVYLPAGAMKKYRSMEEDFVTWLDSGETITAANALVKMLRLQQITGGWLEDECFHTHKLAALKELVDDSNEKFVIFCQFTKEIFEIKKALTKQGRKVKELSGRIKELSPDATYPKDCDVLVCQIQAGGVGIDLTEARICIYYSTGFNRGNFDQSLARVHRPGQDRKVLYYHLVAEETIDQYVRENLEKKGNMVEAIMESMKCLR